MSSPCFISDLHLSAHTAAITANFLAFLERLPNDLPGLYILGDLFDVWLGDDDPARYIQPIQTALQQAAKRFPVYFQAGNRDFLLGQAFARKAGLQLLPEEHCIDIGGNRILLLHGDQLCTDDQDYQKMRAFLRHPATIDELLGKSIEQRRQIAAHYRQQSGEAMSSKAADIMDVNQQAVEAIMRRHGVTRLIHGHTHRPARHRFTLDGQPAWRWVLADWRVNDQVDERLASANLGDALSFDQ